MITETTAHCLLVFDLLKETKDYRTFPAMPAWRTLSQIQAELSLKISMKDLELAVNTLLAEKSILKDGSEYAYLDTRYWSNDFGYAFNNEW